MPRKDRPLPADVGECHAQIRTLQATLRQRFEPPSYVGYLVRRLLPHLGIQEIVEVMGPPTTETHVKGWLRGRSIARPFLRRPVVHALEERLWRISTALRKRRCEKIDDHDDTWRGEDFALHDDRPMSQQLAEAAVWEQQPNLGDPLDPFEV